MLRVTKGDIAIECADQAELAMALAALRATETDVAPLPGVHIPGAQFGPLRADLFTPEVPPLDCSIGTASLGGEYISEADEQRLRLVPDPYRFGEDPSLDPNRCGPAGDPRTDTFLPGEVEIDYTNAPVVDVRKHGLGE